MITIAGPIDADTLRIRHEFLTRADLRVSPEIVAELLGMPLRHARVMLDALVFEHFLACTTDGSYVRSAVAGAGRG